jgi:NADH dehydrogenase FAD-containing subunit
MTGTAIKEINRDEAGRTSCLMTTGEVKPFGMMVWSTGVKALDFIKDMNVPHAYN